MCIYVPTFWRPVAPSLSSKRETVPIHVATSSRACAGFRSVPPRLMHLSLSLFGLLLLHPPRKAAAARECLFAFDALLEKRLTLSAAGVYDERERFRNDELGDDDECALGEKRKGKWKLRR